MDNKKEIDALNLWPKRISNRIEIITPHKITVVFLIKDYLETRMVKKRSTKFRREYYMLLLRLIQYPDISYKDLYISLLKVYDGESLDTLDNIIEQVNTTGVNILFDIIRFVDKLMSADSESVGINQFGIVGLYIRRIILALDKLLFPEMLTLHSNLKSYFDKGIRALAISGNTNCTNDITNNPGNSNGNKGSPLELRKNYQVLGDERKDLGRWSIKQADLFVSQQCNLLETNETLALSPREMQSTLKEIIQDNPLYSQAHILNYMNNLRIRDVFSTLDSFHRAFDRSAAEHSPDNRGFQYSSLKLAIMHTEFGHYKEALTSLRECVMLAQECGDRMCLQMAQSWLYVLDKNHVQLNEKSIGTQTELALIYPASLSVQFIVNSAATTGCLPSKLFELLMKSEVINSEHSLMHLMSNTIAQKASIWNLYGKHNLASLCNQLLLHSVRIHARRQDDNMENGETICLALCFIALWICIQGEYSLSAVILQYTRERFPRDPLSKFWLITLNYITSIQSIYRLNWDMATKACCQLYTLNETVSLLQRASLNIARRNIFVGKKLLLKLLERSDLEPINRVRTMILMANVLFTNENCTFDVVNILNEASVIANEKYLSYEASIIDVHFAYMLLTMKMPQQALKTIKGCMETILANGGIYDNGKVLFLFVRCMVAAQNTVNERIEKITQCLPILNKAIGFFTKLEVYAKVKDIYIYLAQFYNSVNKFSERNKYALKFRLLQEQYPTPVEYLNVFY